MKFRQVAAELSNAHGQTDNKLIIAFRNFAKAPEIFSHLISQLTCHSFSRSLKFIVFFCFTSTLYLLECLYLVHVTDLSVLMPVPP